ncbi:hypothetical protein A7D27_11720 [Pseudomonas sp. 1D4]|uniref:hypothetical protein n=1 Tax=Pseudomonadaceae TaxID=135621 RepID=UPI00084B6EEE|nr:MULTISPECIES: hypothetical protein [Pseudomonas]OEC42540.1 hypothetical protein A7D27_11720 [Pseudomonas sp. 1D4]
MARARNIKPGFFENELLAELGAFDRLLFLGLWTLADREGRLEDRPKRIKIKLFPGDDYDVERGLEALAGKGFISRYQVEGYAVVEVCNFLKHQKPHGTEKDSTLPDANGFLTVNERGKGGCVTGNKRLIHVNGSTPTEPNNVNPTLDNGSLTVGSTSDNALILRLSDSPNPEEEHPLPPEGDAAVAAVDQGEQGEPGAKPGRKKRDPAFDAMAAKPENVSAEVWAEWVRHRREIRKPLTQTSCARQVAQLANCAAPDAVILESIANGWQGLFPGKSSGPPSGKPSNFTNLPKHTPDSHHEEPDHVGPNF